MTDRSLLDLGSNTDVPFLLRNKTKTPEVNEATFNTVKPFAGFCVKTSETPQGTKFFINICYSDSVPSPKEISEEQLIEIIQEESPSFKIPMSVGEIRAEMDKNAEGCSVCDIIICPRFLRKVLESQVFKAFLIGVVIESIESKYSRQLCRDYIILKNKKAFGNLVPQHVRTRSKPVLIEEGDFVAPEWSPPKKSPCPRGKLRTPEFVLIRDPPVGCKTKFLIVQVYLPEIISCDSINTRVGGYRFVMTTRSQIYSLSLVLPFKVDDETSGGQFDVDSRIMTVTMPCLD